MGVAEWHRAAVESFVERVEQVRPDDWSRPTPCAGWSVRDLVNHVVSEERWAVPLFAGSTLDEVGDRFDGDLLGDDAAGQARVAGQEAAAAVSAPGALDRTVHLSFGDTPGEEYARQLFADHLIHGWDLAAAIGADRSAAPELVEAVASWYAGNEEAYRSAGVVARRVAVAADADPWERLLAAFGRDPAWTRPD